MTWRQSWYGGATARPMWAMKAQQKMTDRKTGTRSCRSWVITVFQEAIRRL